VGKKIRYTNNEYISRAKKLHGDTYDYSLIEYKTSRTPVKIICNIHGPFEIRAYSHLQGIGCNKCGIERTRIDFFEKVHHIHGNEYDYSHVKYKRLSDKVKIICNKHGEFLQEAGSHLRGHGCLQCANENKSAEGLYCDSYFSGSEDKNGIFYVIEMWNDEEHFIKIGITKNDISSRFGSKLPYYKKIISTQDMPLKVAFEKEQHILSSLHNFRYEPKIKFTGHTECLQLSTMEQLTDDR
jgi:hypothetical protein